MTGRVPVPVELTLLRALAPDLALRPGTVLPARVLDRSTLMLAGARLAAAIPADVPEGVPLRLRVSGDGRAPHLEVVPARQATAALPAVMTAAVVLPGGATVRMVPDESDGEGSTPAGLRP